MQRKFPPGKLVTNQFGDNLMMVVGYVPTSPRVRDGRIVNAASWLVLVLWRGGLTELHWESLNDRIITLEDWEAK